MCITEVVIRTSVDEIMMVQAGNMWSCCLGHSVDSQSLLATPVTEDSFSLLYLVVEYLAFPYLQQTAIGIILL